jgi:hypothetical protein
MERSSTLLLGWMASLAIHLAVASFLVTLPAPPMNPIRAARLEVPFEPVTGADVGTRRAGPTADTSAEVVPGGVPAAQNIDAASRGEGGDRTGAAEGIRLLHQDDGILLFDSPLNNVAAGQTQRIRTSRTRTTREARRATPNPGDDPFLASGRGPHRERRPVRRLDPRAGAPTAPTAAARGGAPGQVAGPVPSAHRPTPPAPAGADEVSPGRGILGGRGEREDDGARVAHGRPPVDQGPAATQASTRDVRVQDDTDAELLATQMMQSWVEATARTAPTVGEGRGGVGGGGAPGSGGGVGEGGRSAAYGPGGGGRGALDTRDRRYRTWFLELSRRVNANLVFPRDRMLAMDQGTSIYVLVFNRDGSLAGHPRLVRSSGFDDLDDAALTALTSAVPYPALPEDLAPDLRQLRVRFPVEFSNPMVR